jgi:tetratricopeptide (TPR) repeat protein
MRYAVLILLGLVLSDTAHAQKQGQLLVDSLVAELPRQREDTNMVNILNTLSREHKHLGNYDTALYYADQALGQADKIAFAFGIAMACNRKGNVYLDLGDHARALEYYRKALGIYGQGGNRSGIALILGNIGVVYEGQNDYPKALEYYQSALTADEQLGNVESVARHLGNMAHVYIELSEYPRALQYLQRALTINERYGNTRRLAINLASIGNVYDHMHDFPKALEYYQRALSISERSGYIQLLASNLTNIGGIHYDLADFPKALEFHQKALIIHEQLGDGSGMAASFGNIGIAYQALADFPKALEYAQRSLAISRELDDKYGLQCDLGNIGIWYTTAPDAVMRSMGIDPDKKYQLAETYLDSCMQLSKELNMLDEEKKNWGHLSDLYEKQGDFAKAYAAYKEYIVLRDSIQGEEAKKQITRKEMQYEFDKKEAVGKAMQEKKDERQRLVRNGIAGGLAFALLFLGVVWRQRNKIAKARRRSDELLLNILPEEVAEELKEKGEAEAVHIDQVTVLFTDFKGFTAMSEAHTEGTGARHPRVLQRLRSHHGEARHREDQDHRRCLHGRRWIAHAQHHARHRCDEGRAGDARLHRRRQGAEDRAGPPLLRDPHRCAHRPCGGGHRGREEVPVRHLGRYGEHGKPHGEQRRSGQVNISEATYALVHATVGEEDRVTQ